MVKKGRLVTLAAISVLPMFLKRPLYRWIFGYKIGKGARIGIALIDANTCEIGESVSIGHLNAIVGVDALSIGEYSRIGALNIIRGGKEVRIGRYCDILRLNEINSIPEPDVVNEADPRFIMGDGSMMGASHKVDFTDRVEFGSRVIMGGRNSSIWTHNRQKTLPVSVGARTYLGSEIRIAPGVEVAANCIVGMGSVLTGKLGEEFQLIGGVPAKVIKPLDDEGRFLVERKTRNDLPDDI